MRRLAVCTAAALLLSCTGCSAAADRGREPENTVLVQVLGVDWMDGTYLLTAAGTNGEGETVLQTAGGDSLSAAFDALPGAGEQWISLTNVTHFLVGDGAVLQELLLYILDESGMSWRANVWYAGYAGALMEELDDGGIARLTVLEQSGQATVTVLDALAGLTETGEVALPALRVYHESLQVAGAVHYEVVS